MKQSSLLIVDDDRHLLESMSDWLRSLSYRVECAASCQQAYEWLSKKPFDLVLADVRLEDGDGFGVLAHVKEHHPHASVLLITGYGSVDAAVQAIRAGAFDYLTKPLIDEELHMAIERALGQQDLVEENARLKEQLDRRFGLDHIVGQDHRMQRIFDLIDSVADTKATILISGESGTGKSMIARAIHRRSMRREGSFVEVACGALPETLLESELFGHVAGAFTGATTDKMGKFKQADGGTIFLDEIGTASLSMQVKLLRVLQEFEFEQVGGTKTYHVDSRVVLATNDDLMERVADGTFRQDLYYRINVINVELPRLRDRVMDIPLLARHFLQNMSEETGRIVKDFTPDAVNAMQAYTWPGNVRELQNVVERAVLLGKSDVIDVEDLPLSMARPIPRRIAETGKQRTLKEALEIPERQIILEVLESHQWNRQSTAEALGINRTTLYKKMKRLGLEEAQPAGI